ncbi:MAG: LLM class flavin-dependent oxidoreductase [Nitrospinae bacterium]|nr:LLM class flavin-dependent oxidoreductase [Nitrospinota bacterium]
MTQKGIVLWHQETIDARDVPRFARWCEDSGIDSLWFPETWVRDGGILIAMAAQAVDKIKLGAAVFNIYGRTPGLMAQTAAELDVLSSGRFHL